ncbi:MAG: transcription antitermination protein NusB, partial [Actinomycetota bacterium]
MPATVEHRRTRSRRRALEVLFRADLLDAAAAGLLADDANIDKVAQSIVEGVDRHREEIDGLIRRFADRWTLERMPVVDRNLLRIGIYEVLHAPE